MDNFFGLQRSDCHSGLDPWLERLTTLSDVEVESRGFSKYRVNGCLIRSDMTTLTDIEGFLCRARLN